MSWVVYYNGNDNGGIGRNPLRYEHKSDWDAWVKRHKWADDTADPALARIKLVGVFADEETAKKITLLGVEE